MDKFVEVRVRPVTRFVVTRYETGQHEEGGGSYGQCEAVGEFDNERYAEMVAEALRPPAGNNRFIVIRDGDFTPETVAYYAQDENEADVMVARLEQETGLGWRIAKRL